MVRHPRWLVPLAATLATGAIGAAPARGDTTTISMDGIGYKVRTTDTATGTASILSVSSDGADNLIFDDVGLSVDVAAGPGCSLLTADRVSCPPDPVPSSVLDIAVGRGNDSVSLAGLTVQGGAKTPAGITSTIVSGGEGGDALSGSQFDETLEGDGRHGNGTAIMDLGEGSDQIYGLGGIDTLRGQGGNDYLNPGGGTPAVDTNNTVGGTRNTVDGGLGSDFLDGGTSLGADVWMGGTGGDTPTNGTRGAGGPFSGISLLNGLVANVQGGDTMSYGTRTYTTAGTAGVVADLDGVADDGAIGEGDEIRADIEAIQGTIRDDTIVGSAAENRLEGLAGVDKLTGGGAADRLLFRDAAADRCYTVTAGDVIEADLVDPTPDACAAAKSTSITFLATPFDETISAVTVAAKLRRAKGGRFVTALSCPKDAKHACKGALAIAAKAKGAPLASRKFTVRPGRSASVALAPSAAGLKALSKVRFARLTTIQKGTSKKGPTTTLSVRRLPPGS